MRPDPKLMEMAGHEMHASPDDVLPDGSRPRLPAVLDDGVIFCAGIDVDRKRHRPLGEVLLQASARKPLELWGLIRNPTIEAVVMIPAIPPQHGFRSGLL